MTDKPPDHSFDRKKPKATFGDVMKGIPAGRPGESRHGDGPPRGGAQRGGPPRGDSERRSGSDRGDAHPGRPPQPSPAEEKVGPEVDVPRGAKPSRPTLRKKGPPPAPEKKGPEVVVVRKPASGAPAEPHAAPAAAAKPALPTLVYSRAHEEADETENFAEMLARGGSDSPKRGLRPGDPVTGVIIQIGQENAFATLKEGGEAMIELRELTGEGLPAPKVGDLIEAFVVSAGVQGIVISKGMAKGAATAARMEAARISGMPVEGTVTGVNKGGLEVDLGGVRGFCPTSQIDVRFVEDTTKYVGQSFNFRVTEVKGADVVLSRRALLEAERQVAAQKLRGQLAVGARLKGTVAGLRDFGAFIDLGGLEGLIHVSELSHNRISHPRDVLKEGQEVEVEVLRIDAAEPDSPDKSKHKERIGLSLRALEQDPWTDVESRFPLGSHQQGKVVRLQPFGAFVELAPGVDGLIHVSNLADRRINHPKEVVDVDQQVEVVVEKVEPGQKRISLALWREGYSGPREIPADAPGGSGPTSASVGRPKVGDVHEVTVDRVEPFGVFVTFPGGRGLIPNVEMGTPKGADHRKLFPGGSKLKAAIIEVDTQGRLKLSKVAAEHAEERAEVQQYLKTNQPKIQGKGFGTLGDLLKAKLKP